MVTVFSQSAFVYSMLRNFIILRRYARKTGMPGINRISKELKDVNDIMDDPEAFGDIESDFMDVHKTHKQHEREIQRRRDQIRHFVVGNKYFKNKQPNFLTYAEKEQIRLLHSRDPNEWNLEKLSESFPATPDVIAKIIKAKWTADSIERVKRHDKTVIENWEMFGQGKFTELDPGLRQHLQKFAKRTPEDLMNLSTTVRPKPEHPKPTRTEFSSIISESMKFRKSVQTKDPDVPQLNEVQQIAVNCKENPFKSTPNDSEATNKPNNLPARLDPITMEEETYLLDKLQNKKPMRFQELLQKNPEIQQNLKDVAINTIANPQGTGILPPIAKNTNFSAVDKFKSNEVEISPQEMISVNNSIPERIRIPRKLWRKGNTYKLSDCYYADDGEFLYRVPGMTGRSIK